MSKIAVVYWSGTGNTEKMAEFVEAGVKNAGGEVTVLTCDNFTAEQVANFDGFAFGCPSMGAEVLEDSFQDMWDSVKGSLSGKKVALFGSYDWGDGEWMRNWEEETEGVGANLVTTGVIANLEPDSEAETSLSALAKALV